MRLGDEAPEIAREHPIPAHRPALEVGVLPPPPPNPPSGMTVSSAPTASVHPPMPSNRFATAHTATEAALQPPVTAGAAPLEPSQKPAAPSSAALPAHHNPPPTTHHTEWHRCHGREWRHNTQTTDTRAEGLFCV